MNRFAVLMALGPKPTELDRLADFCHSLITYEPACASVVIVDDVLQQRDLAAPAQLPPTCKLGYLLNPRMGRGDYHRLTAAVLAGLRWITQNLQVDFVLKVDSDSLIIAPFAQRVGQFFQQRPDVGMCGSYRWQPDGIRKPNTDSTRAFEKLLRQFTLWRRTNLPGHHVQIGYLGKYGRIRGAIRRAVLNGYALGEFCQGGGYALSAAALHAMDQQGALNDPLLWLHTPCGEDVVVSMYVRAAGFYLEDFNRDGEPFGVKCLGLPDSPQRLLQRGFAIIHSVKNHRHYDEAATRAFFRQQRVASVLNREPTAAEPRS